MTPSNGQKTLLITGASSGIGLGLARAALARGDNVVLNGRSEKKLREAADTLGHADRIALAAGDIADPATGERLIAAAVDAFGGAHGLVNNAGHFDAAPIEQYTIEDIDGYLGLVRGTFLATQAFVKHLKSRQRPGSIVNITTILTMRGVKNIPSSAPIAAKGGIQALTANLAIELAEFGIRVNAVAPGVVHTPLTDGPEEQLRQLAQLHPLGRIGEVSDIADAVLYLTDATWVTGAILPVDGGIAAGG